MILQSLVQYYEALEKKGEIPRPGWSKAKAAFALNLTEEGGLISVIPLKIEKVKGKKTVWEAPELEVPQMATRTVGVVSNFLCDNSSYMLGIDNKGKPKRSLDCFQAAGKRHRDILKDADSAAAKAVAGFFTAWQPECAAESAVLSEYLEEILAGANLIFSVNGTYAQEDPAIVKAWENSLENGQESGGESEKESGSSQESGPESENSQKSEKEPGGSRKSGKPEKEQDNRGICLVTGQRTEIARLHGAIKGVQGAQSSGAMLVSFNAPAFESYGKEQSFNAPVGTYAVFAYTTALNHLLSDRRHTSTVGDTTVVCWSEDGEEAYQDAFMAVSEPSSDNQEIVQGVFDNLQMGKAVHVPAVEAALNMEQKFYILGLAPNAARISVRFFYRDSFGNILRHLKEHYDRMEIIRPARDSMEYLGTWRMLQETVNKKSRDKKPASNMAGAAFRAVMSGSRYPDSLYQAVLLRLKADQDNSDAGIYKITRGRAAIIKAYLLRNGNGKKEEITMALNEESQNTAYVLGREFSVLEAVQQDANPGINATIKDRYFNAACATPASIFPVLFKLKNSHIRKLGKGLQIDYEKLLGRLQDKISSDGSGPAYPRRLSLEEQGMFILGYYHQTQKRFEKKVKEENEDGRGN